MCFGMGMAIEVSKTDWGMETGKTVTHMGQVQEKWQSFALEFDYEWLISVGKE